MLSLAGFQIDLALGVIQIPDEKLAALQHVLKQARSVVGTPARNIASIVGRIISLCFAIGPVCRFMSRSLYAVLESRHSWNDCLLLSHEAHCFLG